MNEPAVWAKRSRSRTRGWLMRPGDHWFFSTETGDYVIRFVRLDRRKKRKR